MSRCKETDAQWIDWLYDELAPADRARFDEHVQGCARCRDELASLSRVRAMFRDLPELEPPAAGAAILMHEAGKRAPARAPDNNGHKAGLLALLTGWLQPVLAHPALAAAASLVLVVTVAGSLYLRGESQYAAPVHPGDDQATMAGSPATTAAPSEPARDDYRAAVIDDTLAGDLDQAGAGAGARAGEARAGDAEAEAGDAEPKATTRAKNEAELESEKAVAVDTRRRELALKELADSSEDKDARPARSKRAVRKQAPTSSTLSGALSSDPMAANSADDDGFAAPPSPYQATGEPSGVRLGSAETKAKKPAAKAASTTAGSAGPGRAAAQATRPPPPPADMDMAEAMSGAPAPSSAPVSRAPIAAQSKARDARKDDLAWVKKQHASLISAARGKRCRDAARIAVDILERNPGYYHGNVERSKEMKSCGQYVAEERRMRSKRRSKADSAGAAAEEAAPAETAPAKK